MKYASILLAAALLLPANVLAGEKINPEDYICAEFLATGAMTEPPIFEGLQVDGYYSAANGQKVADPPLVGTVLEEVFMRCGEKPDAMVLPLWTEVRNAHPQPEGGQWQADKTRCRDYNQDPEDGSGFVIWLDGYQRRESGGNDSILESDAKANAYTGACKGKPDALMLDLIREYASKPAK